MAFSDPQPRALLFDVFGTCVDWRKSITNALESAAREALSSPSSSIASRIRMVVSDWTYDQWGTIAQEWRNSYLKFTRELAADGNKVWKTVDQHHLDSLREIMTGYGVLFPRVDDTPANLVHDGSLWDEAKLVELSMKWHFLTPWPDTCQGIKELNRLFYTCTLSNGNVSLLEDMVKHGKIEFTHVFSAEMFKSYKPNPKVYLGAAEKLGLKPSECVMVAAHLDDLKHAKACGFRTIYVERPQEERYPELRYQGIADVWVDQGEQGFVTAAERLGIQVLSQRKRSGTDPGAHLASQAL